MITVSAGLSIVVPVYNSAASLHELVRRLDTVLSVRREPSEIILVNDGSRDASWTVIAQLAGQCGRLVGIDLARNSGQHNALLAGIRAARYAVTITLDDDLQNPPEEIPKLLAALVDDVDVVYGTPQERSHGAWRNTTSIVMKWALANVMGADTAQHISAYRAFRTPVRASFADYRSALVNIDVLLTWGARRFAVVRVAHARRSRGRSNYTVMTLLTHAMNMLTGFSTAPLRLASYLGFGAMALGIGVLLFVLGRYFWLGGTASPGFPFLASTIAIFSGAQLFALGIIGEYLARVHFRLTDRPSYTIRQSTGPDTAP